MPPLEVPAIEPRLMFAGPTPGTNGLPFHEPAHLQGMIGDIAAIRWCFPSSCQIDAFTVFHPNIERKGNEGVKEILVVAGHDLLQHAGGIRRIVLGSCRIADRTGHLSGSAKTSVWAAEGTTRVGLADPACVGAVVAGYWHRMPACRCCCLQLS